MSGSPNDALELALQAAESNPSDDVAWRVVALAAAAGNDPATAEWAIDQALARQRSDPANLLLAARIRLEAGDHDAAEALLADVVQAWPEVVAAPGWSDLLPSGVSTLDVVDLALQRWTAGEPSPEPRAVQPITLALMAGQTDLANHLAEDELGPSLGAAYVAVLTCRTDAMERLEAVPLPERRSPVYWNLVQRAGMLAGNSEDRAARLLQIMTGADAAATLVDDVITPTNENDRGYSADHWGYRRLSLRWPPDQSLPRPDAGLARWFVAPREAVADAGLSETLPDCQ
jgi:hypothetical protein